MSLCIRCGLTTTVSSIVMAVLDAFCNAIQPNPIFLQFSIFLGDYLATQPYHNGKIYFLLNIALILCKHKFSTSLIVCLYAVPSVS